MKVFTIDRCFDCPAYRPHFWAYYDEAGECDKLEGITITNARAEIPKRCPLKEINDEN